MAAWNSSNVVCYENLVAYPIPSITPIVFGVFFDVSLEKYKAIFAQILCAGDVNQVLNLPENYLYPSLQRYWQIVLDKPAILHPSLV
jgi:hypothetical protein